MALKLVTAASAPLVSIAAAKKHVHAEDFTDDDAYLEALVATATAHIDGPEPAWLGRAIGEQQWELRLDKFPTGCIRLPLPPLQSVDAVSYIKSDGTSGTITDFREFGVDSRIGAGFILPAYDAAWPDTRNEPEAVRITFTAGYADVPPVIKRAILLLVGQWYNNREDAAEIKLTEMPTGVDALIMPLRFWPS